MFTISVRNLTSVDELAFIYGWKRKATDEATFLYDTSSSEDTEAFGEFETVLPAGKLIVTCDICNDNECKSLEAGLLEVQPRKISQDEFMYELLSINAL